MLALMLAAHPLTGLARAARHQPGPPHVFRGLIGDDTRQGARDLKRQTRERERYARVVYVTR